MLYTYKRYALALFLGNSLYIAHVLIIGPILYPGKYKGSGLITAINKRVLRNL